MRRSPRRRGTPLQRLRALGKSLARPSMFVSTEFGLSEFVLVLAGRGSDATAVRRDDQYQVRYQVRYSANRQRERARWDPGGAGERAPFAADGPAGVFEARPSDGRAL